MTAATATDAGATAPRVVDATRLARIRWRCRRGMLENDIVLTRFLDAQGATLDDDAVVRLDTLLDLPDNELWDLVAGRTEPADRALDAMVAALRNA